MDQFDSKIARMLMDAGLLNQFQYRSALDFVSGRGGRFHVALLKLGLVHEEKIAAMVSQAANLPMVSLSKMQVDPLAVKKLPGPFCSQKAVFPCAVRDKGQSLWLAMLDPFDNEAKNEARTLSGIKLLRPLVGLQSEIRMYIDREYGAQQEVSPSFSDGGIDLSLSDDEADEEEFKVVDMSGRTLVKHKAELEQDSAIPSRSPVAPTPAPPIAPGPPIGPEGTSPIDPELDQKVDRLLANQKKSARIIQGLVKLMISKGLFSPEEFRDLLKKNQ